MKENVPTKKVFVYGTLKRGHRNHALLQDSKFIGPSFVQNHTLYGRAIPFAVENEGTCINGEVYEIDDLTERNLDELEGYPDWYGKKIVETEYGQAIMYYMEKHEVTNEPLIGPVFG